jgi:hypothetical protein
METTLSATSPRLGRSKRGLTSLTLVAVVAATLIAAPAANASLATTPDAATWGTNGAVFAVVRSGSTLYLGGTFTSVVSPDGSQTQPRSGLAAIDLTTGQPTAWDPSLGGLSSTAYAMALSADGATIYVGGDFSTAGGEPHSRLAAVDAATGAVSSSWSAGFDGRVRALAVDGTRLYVGGSFEHWNTTTTRLRLAAVDAATGTLLPWAPSSNNTVRTIVIAPDGRVILGGFFTEIDGDPTQQYIAALDSNGNRKPWAGHPDRPIIAMSQANGTVYSGSGGEPGGYAWANDLSTGALLWSVPSDGDVQAIALADGRVVAGGHFIGIGGETIHHLAALDPATGTVDPTWAPQVNGSLGIAGMAVTPNELYIAGDFTAIGGSPYRSIASFAVTAGANAAPVLSVSAPADGDAFRTSDRITFSASASDFEDGDLTSIISWSSNIDGRLGTGGNVAKRLSAGAHRITVKVKDSSGSVASRTMKITVANSKPRIKISSPTDGSSYQMSDTLSFQASAKDYDDGDLTSSISWSSDIDGSIGTGGSFTRMLTPGSHTVTASVSDSGGAIATAAVAVHVASGNQPPVVTITGPPDGTKVAIGSRVSFTGTALDPQQGDLGASISWSSSIDGPLGTGAGVEKQLSEGTHTIRAKTVDAAGAVGRAAISVVVGNASPTVTIASPVDGATVLTGTQMSFQASASDPEDGSLTDGISWASNLDGALGGGGSFTNVLSIGTHTITASITDSRGASSTASVTVSVTASNSPPSVSITSPTDASRFKTRDQISFAAAATDAESGGLSGSIEWSSSIDGPLGTGGALTTRLGEGTHTITASVTDGGGLTTSTSITVSVTDTPPQVFVTSPGPGTAFHSGDEISLQGNATDFDDGDLTASIEWSSSLDGYLGTGASLSKRLSAGTHTIRARVTDADGAVARVTVNITVTNTPPTVGIQTPAGGASFRTSNLVSFQGTAADVDDGNLTSAIAWTSDLDGALGTGGSFTRRLSKGTHTITASVSDANGVTRAASVTVTVANTLPTIAISNPIDGGSFGTTDAISFQATASDFDDGSLTGAIVWTSNRDGQLGVGGNLTRSMTSGTHTITANVTDKDGGTRTASVRINVGNTPPVVTIQTPTNGSSFTATTDIAFQGSASDFDDGNLTSSIVWSSDVAGQIGTGGAFSSRLPAGTNVITASVTDAGGATRMAAVTVTVTDTPPAVSISSPTGADSFRTSDDVRLAASASDVEDGDLSASVVWSSSLDGILGVGRTLTKKLSMGSHTVTASVRDAAGMTRTATVTVVVADTPPSVGIQSPADGAVFTAGAPISFRGTANDFDEGDLSGSIVWASNAVGRIGTGDAFTTTLSAGTHVITASVTDANGSTTASTVAISVGSAAPTISLQSPADGASYRTIDDVPLLASASDAQDGNLTSSIVWTSSRDGSIGRGGTVSRKLSKGTHVITAAVTDSEGITSSATVTVQIRNTPPVVAIASPSNGTSVLTKDDVSFQGSASDFDDGPLTSSIVWTSNRDGRVGTGTGFTRKLSKGVHTITASITDVDGSTTTASITVTVANTAPSVTISSPSGGSSFLTRDDVSFKGTASDFDQGSLTGSIAWTSSRDGAIGTGGTFSRRLSKGTHVITARVTDVDGASTTATLTVTVGNTPPAVSISGPSNGSSYRTADSIQFTGTASDFDQGSLSSSIAWASSKDGRIGTGATLTKRLTEGTHVITASVTDADGATRTSQVTVSVVNTPPTVTLIGPSNGSSYKTSDLIQFNGTASDFDQGSLSSSIAWASSKDGRIGTGATLTKRLTKGTHVVTASVTDVDGATTTASVTITVANTPPVVRITAPTNGSQFRTNDTLSFTATADDFDQGSLAGSIAWTSNIDGSIGSGGSFTRHLSRGVHVITASVTDADAATGSASVTITVSNGPP